MLKHQLLSILFLCSLSACNSVTPARFDGLSVHALNDNREKTFNMMSRQPFLNEEDWRSDEVESTKGNINRGGQFVVTAISGGGHRAANFGLGHLLALDSIKYGNQSSLLDEVDVISTVSGGGLGVAAYITSAIAWMKCNPDADLKERPDIYSLLLENPHKIRMMRKQWGTSLAMSMHYKALFSNRTRTDLFESKFYHKLLENSASNSECAGMQDYEYTLKDIYHYGNREHGTPIHIPNATLSTIGVTFPYAPSSISALGLNCIANAYGAWAGPWRHIENSIDFPYSIGLLASAAFPPMLPDVRIGKAGENWSSHNKICNSSNMNYVHLTDGGQSDDNGYYTAVNVLIKELGSSDATKSNSINEVKHDGKSTKVVNTGEPTENSSGRNSNSALLMTVDSLTSAGHFWSHDKTQNFLRVLLLRNADLPRHGPKRLIGQELESLAEKFPSRLNELPENSSVYAAHVKMTEPFVPNSTPGTFITAVGLDFEEQSSSMAEGMMQTYQSLYGVEREPHSKAKWSKQPEIAEPFEAGCLDEKELEKHVVRVAENLVCNSLSAYSSDESEEVLNKCRSHDDGIEPMTFLKKYIETHTKSCKKNIVTVFEKSRDDSAWTKSLITSNNTIGFYRNTILSSIAFFKTSAVQETNELIAGMQENLQNYRENQLKIVSDKILENFSEHSRSDLVGMKDNYYVVNEKLSNIEPLITRYGEVEKLIAGFVAEYIERLELLIADDSAFEGNECIVLKSRSYCSFDHAGEEFRADIGMLVNSSSIPVTKARVEGWLTAYKNNYQPDNQHENSFFDALWKELVSAKEELIDLISALNSNEDNFNNDKTAASNDYLLARSGYEEKIDNAIRKMDEICEISRRSPYEESSLSGSFLSSLKIANLINDLAEVQKSIEVACKQRTDRRFSPKNIQATASINAFIPIRETIDSIQKRLKLVDTIYADLVGEINKKRQKLEEIYEFSSLHFSATPANKYENAVRDVARVNFNSNTNADIPELSSIPSIKHQEICQGIFIGLYKKIEKENIKLGDRFRDICSVVESVEEGKCRDERGLEMSKQKFADLKQQIIKFHESLMGSKNSSVSSTQILDEIRSTGENAKRGIAESVFYLDSEAEELFCVYKEQLVAVIKKAELQARKHATFVRRQEALNLNCFLEKESCAVSQLR